MTETMPYRPAPRIVLAEVENALDRIYWRVLGWEQRNCPAMESGDLFRETVDRLVGWCHLISALLDDTDWSPETIEMLWWRLHLWLKAAISLDHMLGPFENQFGNYPPVAEFRERLKWAMDGKLPTRGVE
jgi:hypothetical protein